MAFSDQIKLQRYRLANGRCECVRISCVHLGRCSAYLAQPLKATAITSANLSRLLLGQQPAYSYPGFEFHHKLSQASGGADTLINSEFLCTRCHQGTRSYGTNLARQ